MNEAYEAASGTARRGWNELGWLRTRLVGPRRSLASYPSPMRTRIPTRPAGRVPRRGAFPLAPRAASWLLAATVAAPVPAALAATGVWRVGEDDSLVGRTQSYVATYEDTLLDVARRFGMGLAEMQLANPGVDMFLPGEGTAIHLPTRFILPAAPRSGLVINVPEMRIYYYPKGEEGTLVHSWPISIGRVGWETPLGLTRIVRKAVRPTWRPPESILKEYRERGEPLPRVVRPGPDNPLGSHALYLGLPAYLIHGTNRPYSIGMRVSHGCVRLYPEDIEELYGLAKTGTPVNLVHQIIKVGWSGNELFVEVHPEIDMPDEGAVPDMADAVSSIAAALPAEERSSVAVDWKRVAEALAAANGVPVAVGSRRNARPSGGSGSSG